MFAKVAVISVVLGLAYSGGIGGNGRGGVSDAYGRQLPNGQYGFGYDILGHDGARNSRHETGGPGYASGSYQIRDIDGRARTVQYVADHLGFRARINTNEPGTVQHYAAAASYQGPQTVPSFEFKGHNIQNGGY